MSAFTSASPSPTRFVRAAMILVPLLLLLGNLSGRLAGAADGSPWFEGLTKPGFYPPGWAFGAGWTLLYILMALAAAIVAGSRARGSAVALGLFAVQLGLNLAWAPLFFRAHLIGASVALIVVIFLAALLTAWRFAAIARVAGGLMLPYLLWLAFAAVLDARLWSLNPGGSRFVENPTIEVPLAQE